MEKGSTKGPDRVEDPLTKNFSPRQVSVTYRFMTKRSGVSAFPSRIGGIGDFYNAAAER